MATEEDNKNENESSVTTEEAASLREELPAGGADLLAIAAGGEGTAEVGAAPIQLGTRRFVFAAYFAFAILVAFIFNKAASFAWYRLSQWKPQFGEEKAEALMVVSAIVGAVVAVYYWRNKTVHSMIEEIATELAKVTWPTKQEVWNNTTVVIVTTGVATAFFALMDRFWSFVTDWVYRT